ncbi:MAG: DUF4249 domain-containing protein [Sphingobacteriaceae bacterium]|nr:DUF4249 domain-containing protein [Sphingobacteriaceae bacterium]
MKITITYLILFALLFNSCRKDIKLNIPDYQQKVVVEASIETNGPPIVLLSWSVPYFGTFDFTTPEKAFIKGAKVIVSDGILTDTLVELDPSIGYFYAGLKIKGEVGKTYQLQIEVNGKTYNASSSIRTPAKLDSLYFKGEQDSLGYIWQRFSEPAGVGDFYRWFAKRITKDDFYAAPFGSAFDDKYIDGKSFDFAYDRGPQPNKIQEFRDDPEQGYFKRGDTVIVKFCKIGKEEYDFWNTYYQNKASNSNPFSAPSNIKSMLNSNDKDVFGSFTAYSPSFDTIIIPKK